MANATSTALVTGASSGIGEALCWEFAEHGHHLILVARSADKLEQLAAELTGKYKVKVSVQPADLSVPGSAKNLRKALRRKKQRVDILVNNAGVLQHGAFAEMTSEDHQRMINVNVAGLTDILAHFVPDMLAKGSGRILNVASIAAFQPVPSMTTYAATKAYVLSLSEALAEELRNTGVSVTVLCPGITQTNMLAGAESALERVPAMLVGDVSKVAHEAYEACMSGKTIVVPGTLNLAGTLAARVTPKWLLRRFMGVAGRSTL